MTWIDFYEMMNKGYMGGCKISNGMRVPAHCPPDVHMTAGCYNNIANGCAGCWRREIPQGTKIIIEVDGSKNIGFKVSYEFKTKEQSIDESNSDNKYIEFIKEHFGIEHVFAIGDYAIVAKDSIAIPKGTRVKIIGVSGKGYDIITEYGLKLIEVRPNVLHKE